MTEERSFVKDPSEGEEAGAHCWGRRTGLRGTSSIRSLVFCDSRFGEKNDPPGSKMRLIGGAENLGGGKSQRSCSKEKRRVAEGKTFLG